MTMTSSRPSQSSRMTGSSSSGYSSSRTGTTPGGGSNRFSSSRSTTPSQWNDEMFVLNCIEQFNQIAEKLKKWAVAFRQQNGHRPKPSDFKANVSVGDQYALYVQLKTVLKDRIIMTDRKTARKSTHSENLQVSRETYDKATTSARLHEIASYADENINMPGAAAEVNMPQRRKVVEEEVASKVRDRAESRAKSRTVQLLKYGVTQSGASADLCGEAYRGSKPKIITESYGQYKDSLTKSFPEPAPSSEASGSHRIYGLATPQVGSVRPMEGKGASGMGSPVQGHGTVAGRPTNSSETTPIDDLVKGRFQLGEEGTQTIPDSRFGDQDANRRPPRMNRRPIRDSHRSASTGFSSRTSNSSVDELPEIKARKAEAARKALRPPAERTSALIQTGAFCGRAMSTRKHEKTQFQRDFAYIPLPRDEYESNNYRIKEGYFANFVRKARKYADYDKYGNIKSPTQ